MLKSPFLQLILAMLLTTSDPSPLQKKHVRLDERIVAIDTIAPANSVTKPETAYSLARTGSSAFVVTISERDGVNKEIAVNVRNTPTLEGSNARYLASVVRAELLVPLAGPLGHRITRAMEYSQVRTFDLQSLGNLTSAQNSEIAHIASQTWDGEPRHPFSTTPSFDALNRPTADSYNELLPPTVTYCNGGYSNHLASPRYRPAIQRAQGIKLPSKTPDPSRPTAHISTKNTQSTGGIES